MSVRVLAAALVVLAACGGSRGAAQAPSPPHAPTHAVSATPPPSFDDMMGAVPAATVYVISGREVLAVALLNHFVRYRIPVGGSPELAVSPDGASLYVLDISSGLVGLRRFEVASGERTAATMPKLPKNLVALAPGGRTMAASSDGRLLLSYCCVNGTYWIEAYDGRTLEPLSRVSETTVCAQRLLAAARLAIACLASGDVFLDDLGGGRSVVSLGAPLAEVAMSPDGAVFAAHASGVLRKIASGTSSAETLRSAALPDGVLSNGLAADALRLVVATGGREPRLYTFGTYLGDTRASLKLPHAPASGILAFGQFAYWVDADATGVYHVDLSGGLVERMYGPLERGAWLAALAPR